MAKETKGSGSRWESHLRKAAETTSIPYNILETLMEMESSGRPKVISKKGAIGLMQLMPTTARMLKVDPWNPEENIMGGARYLADMLKRFGSMEKALWAYNAGPTRIARGSVPRGTKNFARRILKTSKMKEPWEPLKAEEEATLGPMLRRMLV